MRSAMQLRPDTNIRKPPPNSMVGYITQADGHDAAMPFMILFNLAWLFLWIRSSRASRS